VIHCDGRQACWCVFPRCCWCGHVLRGHCAAPVNIWLRAARCGAALQCASRHEMSRWNWVSAAAGRELSCDVTTSQWWMSALIWARELSIESAAALASGFFSRCCDHLNVTNVLMISVDAIVRQVRQSVNTNHWQRLIHGVNTEVHDSAPVCTRHGDELRSWIMATNRGSGYAPTWGLRNKMTNNHAEFNI